MREHFQKYNKNGASCLNRCSIESGKFPSSEGLGVGKIKAMKKRKILTYNPKLKFLARKLRQNMTFSEILLWQELKGKQMKGYDFDRQKPIDNYIVDFYCKDLMLAIEIDGDSHTHGEIAENDIIRQERLESLGIKFLRFDDMDVKKNMGYVLDTILVWIEEYEKTHP